MAPSVSAPPDWLPQLVALAVFYLFLLAIRRRREAIRLALRRLLLVALAYLGVVAYLSQTGWGASQTIIAGVLTGLVVDSFIPRRTRYIPGTVKRRAIARWEQQTGQKFNPRVHELDHVIPFSKGGSNTADNLRVVTRRENRSKGAKSPWWDLLGH